MKTIPVKEFMKTDNYTGLHGGLELDLQKAAEQGYTSVERVLQAAGQYGDQISSIRLKPEPEETYEVEKNIPKEIDPACFKDWLAVRNTKRDLATLSGKGYVFGVRNVRTIITQVDGTKDESSLRDKVKGFASLAKERDMTVVIESSPHSAEVLTEITKDLGNEVYSINRTTGERRQVIRVV